MADDKKILLLTSSSLRDGFGIKPESFMDFNHNVCGKHGPPDGQYGLQDEFERLNEKDKSLIILYTQLCSLDDPSLEQIEAMQDILSEALDNMYLLEFIQAVEEDIEVLTEFSGNSNNTCSIGDMRPTRIHYNAVISDLQRHQNFYCAYQDYLDYILIHFWYLNEYMHLDSVEKTRLHGAYQRDRKNIAKMLNKIGEHLRDASLHPWDCKFIIEYYYPEEPLVVNFVNSMENYSFNFQNIETSEVSESVSSLIENFESIIEANNENREEIFEKEKISIKIDFHEFDLFAGNNPDIDYSRITWGCDRIDNDADPTLQPGTGNEHGTHVLGIIGATKDNGIGIEGLNDKAPVWLGRAVGSGQWADSLTEYVDAVKASGRGRGVVNLSFDLTQVNPDGAVSVRYEFTPEERAALEYARQNHILIVVVAGNDAGLMSVLGQAFQEFENILTVGAADEDVRLANGSGWISAVDMQTLSQHAPPINSQNQRVTFENYFSEIVFNHKSQESRKLISICQKLICQYSLDLLVEPSDILHEAYLRSIANINRGSQIWNPYSYIKQIAINCIRELSKSNPRHKSIEVEDIASSTESYLDLLFYQQVQERINEQLSPLENRLLCLRELERIPYPEIAEILEQEGFESKKPAALRQMRVRLIEKLKDSLFDYYYPDGHIEFYQFGSIATRQSEIVENEVLNTGNYTETRIQDRLLKDAFPQRADFIDHEVLSRYYYLSSKDDPSIEEIDEMIEILRRAEDDEFLLSWIGKIEEALLAA